MTYKLTQIKVLKKLTFWKKKNIFLVQKIDAKLSTQLHFFYYFQALWRLEKSLNDQWKEFSYQPTNHMKSPIYEHWQPLSVIFFTFGKNSSSLVAFGTIILEIHVNLTWSVMSRILLFSVVLSVYSSIKNFNCSILRMREKITCSSSSTVSKSNEGKMWKQNFA